MKTKKLILFIFIFLALFLIIFFLLNKVFYPWKQSNLEFEEVNSVLINQLEEGKNSLAIYPDSNEMIVKKGGQSDFYFSYKNFDKKSHFYDYAVVFKESNCGVNLVEAQEYISFRRDGHFELNAGETLQTPILIQFSVPKNVSSCLIKYGLFLSKDYQDSFCDSTMFTLQIK